MANLESDEEVLRHIQKKDEEIVMEQKDKKAFYGTGYRTRQGPSLLKSHVMMTGCFDPDLGQQVSIEDGSGVDLSLEEGVVMT